MDNWISNRPSFLVRSFKRTHYTILLHGYHRVIGHFIAQNFHRIEISSQRNFITSILTWLFHRIVISSHDYYMVSNNFPTISNSKVYLHNIDWISINCLVKKYTDLINMGVIFVFSSYKYIYGKEYFNHNRVNTKCIRCIKRPCNEVVCSRLF